MHLILYSKPGCHLCEGLQEKLEQIQADAELCAGQNFDLEIRDITTRDDWFQAYQYEIPVVFMAIDAETLVPLPRPSPRASVQQVARLLQKCLEQSSEA